MSTCCSRSFFLSISFFCALSLLDISGVAGEYQTKWAGTLNLSVDWVIYISNGGLGVLGGMCISNGVMDGGEGLMMMDEV
jgi:hypothetical protein